MQTAELQFLQLKENRALHHCNRLRRLMSVGKMRIRVKKNSYMRDSSAVHPRIRMELIVEAVRKSSEYQFEAPPLGASDGIPTKMSMLTGFPAFTAGLKVHRLNASLAAASISCERP